jgi:quaternary ammonium compound-resistance protein SugE
MGWIALFFAGLFEIGFASALKLMDNHRNIPWTAAFYVCVICSFGLLEYSLKTIPIGTAYAIWTGIGGVGVAVIGIIYMGDTANPLRIFFLVSLIGSLIGLKLTSGH